MVESRLRRSQPAALYSNSFFPRLALKPKVQKKKTNQNQKKTNTSPLKERLRTQSWKWCQLLEKKKKHHRSGWKVSCPSPPVLNIWCHLANIWCKPRPGRARYWHKYVPKYQFNCEFFCRDCGICSYISYKLQSQLFHNPIIRAQMQFNAIY